ncbi:uncharacterized protein BCR38DRAFT_124264 [Pseudomassariella vexata]|uniref:Uncharacterized protein n=1 Tax=Pseudomassariella vexata TaxID=1141098 RepID=A0A1Y2D864_9PEZI|nr:uncharacterized protein BCR38DRAFT_124264 [Pseudomassariella vexata]ORY55451.1 hypothetical protein BCR38DRAFT_124264 [Pseudomassariella vexata]
MRFNILLPALIAAFIAVQASPMPCPDATRDAILKGDLPSSACCGYGVCKDDIIIEQGHIVRPKW